MKLYGSLSRLVSILFRKDSQDITVQPNQSTTYTAARAVQLPEGDTAHVLVSRTSTDTLTNKTLTAPAISSPTGLVKADVGLANVDNTSDATKNSATATLTNKTIDGDDNTLSDISIASLKTVLGDADEVVLRDAAGAVVSAKLVNANVDAAAAIAYSKLSIADGDLTIAKTSGLQTALDGKVDENAAITGATKTKITYDAKGLVTAGADLAAGDLPTGIDAAKIADGSVSNAEFQYLGGVTSDIQTQFTGKQSTSEKGQANGYASLDGGGKVPVAQLPSSVMTYEGTWAASTNTPTLANGTGDAGMVYLASDAGTVDFGAGNITFAAGDWAIYSGTIWEKSINSNAVVSVNGATGVVTVNAINELTGDVTTSAASGSQSKAATIANSAITNAKVAAAAAIDVSKLAAGTDTYQLTTVAGVPTWTAPAAASVTVFAADWITADTATKAVTHSLGTKNIRVEIYDKTDDSTIMIDSIVRTSTSVVTLSASEAPGAAGWKVLIIAQ